MVLMLVSVGLLALGVHTEAFVRPPSVFSPARPSAAWLARPASLIRQRIAEAPCFDAWRELRTPRGGNLALSASGSAPAEGGGAKTTIDFPAIAKYIAGTGVEFAVIMGLLYLVQTYLLAQLGAPWGKAAVFVTFGFLAMKSRTFSPLNARRPDPSEETEEKAQRRRPQWMPPPKVFPFIWITIGLLRAVSSAMVWEALGGELVSVPIAAMVLHLSVGDTWNHINNVEKRLGVAVPVVFLVWLSVVNAAWRYYQTLPEAGLVLLPSVIWISVANVLVQAIWRLNGKEPLYPVAEVST